MSAFDGLTFKQELTRVGVPMDQAEALSALIRDQVVGNAATKDDLLTLERRTRDDFVNLEKVLLEKIDRVEERLRSEIKHVGQDMTIKLGSMFVVAVGILLAAQRFFQ